VFGLTTDEHERLCRWVFERVGYVVGGDGRGGSGVFVKTSEGRIALLTARHVAAHCILTGELQVAACIDGQGQFETPLSVHLSTKCDAALMTMPEGFAPPAHLELDAWDPTHHSAPPSGAHAIAAGMPRTWKTEPDLEQRRIARGRTLLLWTEVKDTSELHDGRIECKADKRIGDLPSTLRGMSGGPLFTTGHRLLGVIQSETISEKEGLLYSTPRAAWIDLFRHWHPEGDGPPDLRDTKIGHDWMIIEPATGCPIPLQIFAELSWSPSEPNHKYGGYGRIYAIEFHKGDPRRQCLVNLEWIFYFESDHEAQDRIRTLEEEVSLLLSKLSFVER